ncbi:MAG: hypothetical protein Q7U47_13835 [Paludibacter sp.]|nr:hypothetical protein [Paludibacter sp.]
MIDVPHTWVAASIDNEWYLFDPTWGAGYISNSQYISQINDFYFMTEPEILIQTHIPFDPIWQLLNYPVTYSEFYQGKAIDNKNKPYFNFNDSIVNYCKLSELDQLIAVNRRIEKNDLFNKMAQNKFKNNLREISHYQEVQVIDIYNMTVEHLNNSIKTINTFIDSRNSTKHLLLTKDHQKILFEAEHYLNLSKQLLAKIENADPKHANYIKNLKKSIEQTNKNFVEQKEFLNKTLSENKRRKKSVFFNFFKLRI